MKVKLSEIPDEGLTLSERLDPVGLKLQTPQVGLDALLVTATFQRLRDNVVVFVETQGQLKMVCDRCLEVYEEPYLEQFNLGYTLEGKQELNVTGDIREEILLTYPVKLVCQESCQGLCTHCGKNLNREKCESKRGV